jgi:peptide deformylase
MARCLQHEYDHLHGKLFLDRLSILKKRRAMRDWEDEKDNYPKLLRVLPVGDLPKENDRKREPHPVPVVRDVTDTPDSSGH